MFQLPSLNRSSSLLKDQISFIVVLAIILVWSAAAYELYRSQQTYLREAEVRTMVQAHVFAEYSRSTLKRINEFMLDVRAEWHGDWKTFATAVQRRQENIDDLTFQVAVIDRDGLLAYSNLASPNDRTDLSQREHFRVHREAGDSDRLYISKPVQGKISGKWSIQLTRPILKNGRFNGVLVVSLSPEQFAGFAQNLGLKGESALTVVRNTGEIMARYPAIESSLAKVLQNVPFLNDQEANAGNYRLTAAVDATERIYGYYRLPEFGLSFVQGDAISEVLSPYYAHRTTVIAGAFAVTALAMVLYIMLFRSLSTLDGVRRQLATIFLLSPDGFVAFDRQRRVEYISPSFSRLTGLDDSAIKGLDEDSFSQRIARLCTKGSPAFNLAAMRAGQDAGRTGNTDNKNSHRHLIELSNAGKRTLEVGIRTSSTESVSQILYFRDVTHETEVDRLKSEFLSTAAHELRTPMASIFGYSELMLHEDFPPDEVREFLGIIHRQSELMIAIINELLDLVRIEERRGKDFDLVRIEAGDLLREVIASFKPLQGTDTPLPLADPAAYWLRGDRKKLTQAISNVLSNAYKYSPEGGKVEFELLASTAEAGAGDIGIRITDHGMGMSADQLARVCERFYRADTSGKIPGTGLGMSIVKEIVELHGGHVSIDSEKDVGTTVTLWVPRA